MEHHINGWKAALTAIIGALTALWGWMGWLVCGWVGLMALDYLTGSAAAARRGAWKSKAARDGIWRKGGMIVVVAVAGGTDLLLALVIANLPIIDLPIAYKGLICPLVLVWYCLTELGSIVENAVAMGAKVPPWLVKLLAVGKGAVDKAGEKAAAGKEE